MRDIKKKYAHGRAILPLSERLSARLGIRGIRIVKMPAERVREMSRAKSHRWRSPSGKVHYEGPGTGFAAYAARRAMPSNLVLLKVEKRETKLPDTYFWVQFRKRRRLAR